MGTTGQSEEVELADRKHWKAMSWAVYDGDLPVMKALRSIFEVEDDDLVDKLKCMGDVGTTTTTRDRLKMEA